MKIEVILADYCLHVGSKGNIDILNHVFQDVDLVVTPANQAPRFQEGGIDLVYVGSYDDFHRPFVYDYFTHHADAFHQALEAGQAMLMTGNGWNFLGQAYLTEAGERLEGLKFFNFEVVEDFSIRCNLFSIGQTEDGFEVGGLVAEFTSKKRDRTHPLFLKHDQRPGL